MEMTREQIRTKLENDILWTYETAIQAGQEIEVNEGLPYIAITRGIDDEYFMQGEEAQNYLTEYEQHVENGVLENVDFEQWMLWQTQSW